MTSVWGCAMVIFLTENGNYWMDRIFPNRNVYCYDYFQVKGFRLYRATNNIIISVKYIFTMYLFINEQKFFNTTLENLPDNAFMSCCPSYALRGINISNNEMKSIEDNRVQLIINWNATKMVFFCTYFDSFQHPLNN